MDLETRIADLIEPARAATVEALLTALAGAISAGAEVEAEPLTRDASGRVTRSGPLDLPARGDLTATRDGRTLPQRVAAPWPHPFPVPAPVSLVLEDGVTVLFEPFAWDDAEIRIEGRQARPDWQPLRLWFLDWVNGRQTDVAPDLSGAVHGLSGPWPQRAAAPVTASWRLGVDFGSAPVSALAGLIEALARSGAARVHFGPASE